MVYIDEKDWNKIIGYAEIAHETMKAEIGGMSVMVQDKDKDWKLLNPVILKQQVTGGNTILAKEELAEYYTKECKRLGDRNFRFCWWHSHHTMAAFWSGTDLTAIDEYNEGDFSFALVVNLKQEYKFRISVWQPVEVHEDVELTIVREAKCTKAMKDEVAELCTKPAIQAYTKTHYNGYTKPYNQATLWQTSENQKELTGYNNLLEVYTDLIDELVDGTIKWKAYSEEVSTINGQLKDGISPFRIKPLTKKNHGDACFRLPEEDIIDAKTKKVVELSPATVDDWDQDDRDWNRSFGGIYGA